MESAALAGLGGRAVGVKAIGSVLGNGLTRNGRLKARTHQFAETTRGNVNCYPPYKSKIYKRGLILSLFFFHSGHHRRRALECPFWLLEFK